MALFSVLAPFVVVHCKLLFLSAEICVFCFFCWESCNDFSSFLLASEKELWPLWNGKFMKWNLIIKWYFLGSYDRNVVKPFKRTENYWGWTCKNAKGSLSSGISNFLLFYWNQYCQEFRKCFLMFFCWPLLPRCHRRRSHSRCRRGVDIKARNKFHWSLTKHKLGNLWHFISPPFIVVKKLNETWFIWREFSQGLTIQQPSTWCANQILLQSESKWEKRERLTKFIYFFIGKFNQAK